MGTPRKYAYVVKRQPEYGSWRSMRQRCTDSRRSDFARYGAVGITVCTQWLESFDVFLSDVGRRPSPRHSLDRYPNAAGNYEPGNVRWATASEQARNRKTTRWITFNGETLCLLEWSRKTGVDKALIRRRIKHGWPLERALSPSRLGRRI